MELTTREAWTVLHGLLFGTVFILAFAGGLAGLWSLRPGLLTTAGIRERMRRLYIGTWVMAVTAWVTVISGTWIVYPWYRAGDETSKPLSAKFQLTADPNTADWHNFGMEWKEHIAWLAPILATVVAFIVVYYGANLIRHDRVRKTAIALYVMAFAFAAVAGALGAFITKVAPVR
jgi:hypothetical protein